MMNMNSAGNLLNALQHGQQKQQEHRIFLKFFIQYKQDITQHIVITIPMPNIANVNEPNAFVQNSANKK